MTGRWDAFDALSADSYDEPLAVSGSERPRAKRERRSGSSSRMSSRTRSTDARTARGSESPFRSVPRSVSRSTAHRDCNACKAAGVPVFSPHDLRHRRISLLHRHGRSWAEIARFVGQRKLSITADTYTHVLSDGREVELDCLLTNYPQARDRSTNAPR